MPAFPIIIAFAGIMALIGYGMGKGKEDPLRKGTLVGAAGLVWNPYTRAWERARKPPEGHGTPSYQAQSPLAFLAQVISSGGIPHPALLEAAYSEAHRLGDYASARIIEQIAMGNLNPVPNQAPAPQVVAGAEESGESGDLKVGPDGEPVLDGYESANPGQVGVPVRECPIPVDPTAWGAFCEALRTRKAAWSSDNHLGCFEHNRHRLRQLGLDPPPGDEESQYRALCADMADYHDTCGQLLRDFTGDVVDVDGKLVQVTKSGVMGLLKAAGPKGAESWLRNKSDRLRFPTTTDIFRRTNGCF